jgi:hypothetical protein
MLWRDTGIHVGNYPAPWTSPNGTARPTRGAHALRLTRSGSIGWPSHPALPHSRGLVAAPGKRFKIRGDYRVENVNGRYVAVGRKIADCRRDPALGCGIARLAVTAGMTRA